MAGRGEIPLHGVLSPCPPAVWRAWARRERAQRGRDSRARPCGTCRPKTRPLLPASPGSPLAPGHRGRGQRRGMAGRALLWHRFGTGNRAHTCAKAAPGTPGRDWPRAQEQGKARISLGFTCRGLGLQQGSPPGEAFAVAGCFPSAKGPVVLSDLEEASGGGEAKPRVCLSGQALPATTRQTLSF